MSRNIHNHALYQLLQDRHCSFLACVSMLDLDLCSRRCSLHPHGLVELDRIHVDTPCNVNTVQEVEMKRDCDWSVILVLMVTRYILMILMDCDLVYGAL